MKNLDSVDRSLLTRLFYTQVETSKDKYIFPIFGKDVEALSEKQVYDLVSNRLSQYNQDLKMVKALCGLSTNLTSHTARHTFSDLSRKLGISIYDISQSLNHSDLKTTQSYLKSKDYQSLETSNKSFYDRLNHEFEEEKAKSKSEGVT